MKGIIPTLALVIGLLDAGVFAADIKGETGTVRGVAFTADADGGRSVVGALRMQGAGGFRGLSSMGLSSPQIPLALPPHSLL